AETTHRTDSSARQVFRKRLREGELDDKEVELELSASPVGVEIMAPPGMEEMTNQLQSMFSNLTKQRCGSSTKRTSRRARSRASNRPASYFSTKSTRWPSAAKRWASTYRAKA